MNREKREFPRYRVSAEMAQISNPPGVTFCSIKNIGENGLALDYQPIENNPFRSDSIDIISHGCYGLHISNISCQTVYDIGRLMENQSFSGGELRTRGLRFVDLTNEQKERLGLLMNFFSHSSCEPHQGNR